MVAAGSDCHRLQGWLAVWARGFGAVLLVLVVLRIVWASGLDESRYALGGPLIEFASGCCTALGNPITVAYFAAEYASLPVFASSALVAAGTACRCSDQCHVLHHRIRASGSAGSPPSRARLAWYLALGAASVLVVLAGRIIWSVIA